MEISRTKTREWCLKIKTSICFGKLQFLMVWQEPDSSVVHREREKWNGHKLKCRTLHLNVRRNVQCEGCQTLEEAAQRCCGVSILGDDQNPTGHSPGRALADPMLRRDLDEMICRGTVQPLLHSDPAKSFTGECMKRKRDELSFSANTDQIALSKNIATACKKTPRNNDPYREIVFL